MNELFEIFSLTTDGDAPIGLNYYKSARINQPQIQDAIKLNPLFSQQIHFVEECGNGEILTEFDCGFKWLNYVNNK